MTLDAEAPSTLTSALRAVAVLLAYLMAVHGMFGYAPQPLYWMLIAAYPPTVAALGVAVTASRGSTRAWLGVSLAGAVIGLAILIVDMLVTRMGVAALRPIAGRPLWNVAAFANVALAYGTLAAGRTIAQGPPFDIIARVVLVFFWVFTLAFIIVKWLAPSPPLVPFFQAGIFTIPAVLLFELTDPKRFAVGTTDEDAGGSSYRAAAPRVEDAEAAPSEARRGTRRRRKRAGAEAS